MTAKGAYQLHLALDESEATVATTPAIAWENDSAKCALDELFSLTRQYKGSKSYFDLMQFVARFRFYSPFNAMLIHIQMPGAQYVAPAHRWLNDFGRNINSNARPLVILQPMGPVMFVFDVSDTEPTEHAKPLPQRVLDPFAVQQGKAGKRLEHVVDNAKRDGIRIVKAGLGSQAGGSIRKVFADVVASQKFQTASKTHEIPVFYDLAISSKFSEESSYATIAHELGHLYCGHLGSLNIKWWPDRQGLSLSQREFEAESVSFLVCARAGIETSAAEYLSGYAKNNETIPAISFESVIKSATLIEKMSLDQLNLRADSELLKPEYQHRRSLQMFKNYKNLDVKDRQWFDPDVLYAGFKEAWQERDYATIITVGRKVPQEVIQENPKLLMWFDQAVTRSGDTEKG